MVTTLENKIKITFEFENVNELEQIFLALNTGCVSIDYRDKHTGFSNTEYLSKQWDNLEYVTDKFNPAHFKNA